MHAYATDAKDRESIALWLAASAVAATLLLNYVLKVLKLQIPWWVDAPSVMGFYGLLHTVFDNFVWQLQFGSVRFSEIPIIQGTWVGIVRSSYEGGTEVREVLMYVRQTWSKISIQLETDRSRSSSTMAAVNTEKVFESGLKYEYVNEPSALSVETMQPHRGTAHLRLAPDRITLEGDYFTGRSRQNIGEMVFRLVSSKRLTRHEALHQASSFITNI